MCIGWRYDYNSVSRWMADRLFDVGGGDLRSRKPFTIFGRLQIRISNDDYLNVGQTTQIAEMRFAHAANAEERDTDGRAGFQLMFSFPSRTNRNRPRKWAFMFPGTILRRDWPRFVCIASIRFLAAARVGRVFGFG